MKRRVVAAAIFVALAASTASAQSRPNVILIYGDDLGYGDVSAHGALRLKTPNIDRLAGEGLRFTDAHSPPRRAHPLVTRCSPANTRGASRAPVFCPATRP
jgi:hypothetical protein